MTPTQTPAQASQLDQLKRLRLDLEDLIGKYRLLPYPANSPVPALEVALARAEQEIKRLDRGAWRC